MKIAVINRSLGQPLGAASVEFLPDSALLTDRKPIFLPDHVGQWAVEIYPTVKIDRLGKSIEKRFASRYYSEWTLGARFTNEALAASEMPGLAAAIDSTWVTGAWLDAVELDSRMTVAVERGSETAFDKPVDMASADADGVIEALSRYATLKTGDLVALAKLPIEVAVEPGDTVTVKVDDINVLKLRIK